MKIKFNNDDIKLGVIGSPISHSLSPLMQNFMLEKLGLNYIYLPFHVKKGDAAEFISACKVMGITGFNATMPHKGDVFSNMSVVEGDARKCSSVNTANFKDGKWFGYSTDGEGFNLSLNEHGIYFKDKNVLILGAGGAARAIVLSASNNNVKNICVLNRNLERAREVVLGILNAKVDSFCYENIQVEFEKADIIINTTPLGMHGMDSDFTNFDFMNTTKKVVCDLIYNPYETNLLKQAKEKGHFTLNGLSMLIYQGILALEIFTDTEINKIEMKKLVHENIIKYNS